MESGGENDWIIGILADKQLLLLAEAEELEQEWLMTLLNTVQML